ncbi:unnamed protein product, partial [Rotaria magnacalcarata]
RQYFERALTIFQANLPSGHPNLAKLQINIQRTIEIQQLEEDDLQDES